MTKLNFTVNGQAAEVEVEDNEYLSDVLRYRLGLTGTKIGCNEAECGTCTVLVDGAPVESCIYPALRAEGDGGRPRQAFKSALATPRAGQDNGNQDAQVCNY